MKFRLVWLVLLVPIHVADAQQQQTMPADGESLCIGGYCIVTKPTLEALSAQAAQVSEASAQAELYARLCGWLK